MSAGNHADAPTSLLCLGTGDGWPNGERNHSSYLYQIGGLHHAFTLGLMEGAGPLHTVIGIGAWLGTFMLFNVWVLIWPNQKKILGFVEATADEIASARKVAFIASRTNTLLSIPMLMSMVGYGHGGFFI